jgi:hypothetical protein
MARPIKTLAHLALLRAMGALRVRRRSAVSMLLFSKDRPLQLDALLRSIHAQVRGDYLIMVLWKASDERYASAYQKVLKHHAKMLHCAVRESSFREDLIGMLKGLQVPRIMFLVDDILFVRPFDLQWLRAVDLWKSVPSLRLHPGVSYCQPISKPVLPPALETIDGSPWLKFSWQESHGDWNMPVALDGHVFNRTEILAITQACAFSAPNSMEQAFAAYRFWFRNRQGLCLNTPSILNFAFNRVQSENTNFPCGDVTAESFLSRFEDGWTLDIATLSSTSTNACHVLVEPRFIKST